MVIQKIGIASLGTSRLVSSEKGVSLLVLDKYKMPNTRNNPRGESDGLHSETAVITMVTMTTTTMTTTSAQRRSSICSLIDRVATGNATINESCNVEIGSVNELNQVCPPGDEPVPPAAASNLYGILNASPRAPIYDNVPPRGDT